MKSAKAPARAATRGSTAASSTAAPTPAEGAAESPPLPPEPPAPPALLDGVKMALVALLLLVGVLLMPPPRVVVLAEPAPELTPPAPLVELPVEMVVLTGLKLAQAIRVLFAKWRTMERLPMKLPRPGWSET